MEAFKKNAGFYPDEYTGDQKVVCLSLRMAVATSMYWHLDKMAAVPLKSRSVLSLSQQA
jgi:hypothetical protein